jgi:hypothetical protein
MRKYIFILKLVNEKNIFYIIFILFTHIFIFPNTSYCEAVEADSIEENEDQKPQKNKYRWIFNRMFELFVFFFILWFIDDCFGGLIGDDDNYNDGYSSDSSESEIKPTPEPYVQGPAHRFIVRNIGIRYEDEVALDTPKLDVNNAADRQYMNEVRELLVKLKELNKNNERRK